MRMIKVVAAVVLDVAIFLLGLFVFLCTLPFGYLNFLVFRGEHLEIEGIGLFIIPVYVFGGLLALLLFYKLRESFSLRQTLRFLPRALAYSFAGDIILLLAATLIAFLWANLRF